MRELKLNIGDTVYYVVGEGAVYSIRKTRIVGKQTRSSGFRLGNNPVFEYIVYQTEDGKLLNESSFREQNDELSASQVFHTKAEAVDYIIHCLHSEINSQWQTLLNAQKRMIQAERVLHMYEKYGK
jgi:hypothetical protein